MMTEGFSKDERIAALEAELEQHKDALVAVDMARKEGLRKIAALEAENEQLTKQRDDLLAALEKIISGVDTGCGFESSSKEFWDGYEEARAAIASVKGGAA